MDFLEKYLDVIQNEYGYANPIQTRPKPTGGITGNKGVDKEDPDSIVGVRGPSGPEVDLDQDDEEELRQHVFSYKFNDPQNKDKENH